MVCGKLAFLMVALLVGNVIGQMDQPTSSPQEVIDYLSNNIDVKFDITTNFENVGQSPRCRGTISFTNTGSSDIIDRTWEIFFCSVRIFEPDTLRDNPSEGKMFGNTNLKVYHINGCMHKIAPTDAFSGFLAGNTIEAPYETADWQVARTDISPNWYFAEDGAEPRTILSTTGQSLDFVGDFTTPEQWKRQEYDEFDPYTPQVRFELNSDVDDNDGPQIPVIPTPADFYKTSDDVVDVAGSDWVVVAAAENMGIGEYLADKLGLPLVEYPTPLRRYIELTIDDVQDRSGNLIDNDEAYRIDIKATNENIELVGKTSTGLRHGAHTVISLYQYSSEMPDASIVDYPRFEYRGMHADVARNFQSKESILKLLDAMAMYKMNKFHFHLTDDEAWRVEIPGLEELTTVGGHRCHDLDETTCIIPQLGSGPGIGDSGSGFYTVDEYKEILSYANDRGIEVIPEVDIPGHCHAAIKAMEARYHRLFDTDPDAAVEYLLSDLQDTSEYLSIQYFRDNAINPCLESTETFVRKVIQEFKAMHLDIQPLKVFHFGGDEVPHGAWVDSPACTGDLTPEERMENFIYRVAEIVNDEGLDLAGWEDGLMRDVNNPYNRSRMPNTEVYGYTWNNIWEWGGGSRAYVLANADYRAIIGHATELYFDMPYEPDPEERGFYWATRFTETRHSFNYIPDSIYDNIAIDRFGRPLSKEDICGSADENCEQLEEEKRPNVVGIQGHLWSETVKTEDQFQYMVFPRMLAVAERGWHKASWEDILDDKQRREAVRNGNWEEFANTLGYKELRRLDDVGISYNVPIPGAKIAADDGVLTANSNFPGLTIQYSVDAGETWTDYKSGQQMPPNTDVHLRTRSADMSRTSRTVMVRSPDWDDGGAATLSHFTLPILCFLSLIVFKIF